MILNDHLKMELRIDDDSSSKSFQTKIRCEQKEKYWQIYPKLYETHHQ